jgi:hypothetical protein
MRPHDIKNGRYFKCVFDTMTVVANMRYFNVQQVALNHRVEEKEINHRSHGDGDGELGGD